MPPPPKGELSLGEIRNLVRQHNKLSTIKGVDSKTRTALLKEVADMGYTIDHAKKKITRGGKSLSSGKAGLVKPNKTTLTKKSNPNPELGGPPGKEAQKLKDAKRKKY